MKRDLDSKDAKPVQAVCWLPDGRSGQWPGAVELIDQTLLPGELRRLELRSLEEVAEAIAQLRVRGAPAIGIAAAMGVLTALGEAREAGDVLAVVQAAADRLASSRPTAVNLFYALDRMRRRASTLTGRPLDEQRQSLCAEALAIQAEDEAQSLAIGRHGLCLLDGVRTVLTHCNTGALAASGYGTALAPVYLAAKAGRPLSVFADETRPLLQGARLTTWELMQAGIEVTLICDAMAAQVMKEGRVDAVLVGADRIAANGDTANKIGTYGLALAARAHAVPFYVLAPSTTFDLSLASGDAIPIEQRAGEEITRGFGLRTAPEGVGVYNPAFDVTPAELITAIVCEQGALRPPYGPAMAAVAKESAS